MVASSTLRSLPFDLLTNILIKLASSILLFLPFITILSRLLRKLLSHGNNTLGSRSLTLCNGFDSLPEELVTNILLRLPAESLLRCKSVCKELHAIISSSSFINMHFNHETNLTRLVLYSYAPPKILHRYSTPSYLPDETTLQKHEAPDNSLLLGEITYFSGPCNGIFCIHITENRFALWNPTTRRLRFTQCCSHTFDNIGFGMDPLTADFKIVLLHSHFGVSSRFAVYTSGSDSWKYLKQKSIRNRNFNIINFPASNTAYYNGFYYWIKTGVCVCTIVAFDMHNEIFEKINMPDIALQGKALHVLNDSLALVSFDPFYRDKHFEIWLMEGKGCWTKFLSVILPFECMWSYGWGTNKILMYTCLGNLMTLMLYDLDSHCAEQLDVQSACWRTKILPIFYKESLFSLKNNDGIQDYDARSAEALEFMGYEGPDTKDQLS